MRLSSLLAPALGLSLIAVPPEASAGPPLEPAADQAALLRSDDPQLAANKRLVYDVMRVVMIAGHVERIGEFMAPDYVQHNPAIASGRDAFVAFMKTMNPTPKPIPDRVVWPLVSMVAEGDLVVTVMIRDVPDARTPGRMVNTGWFDMYRVKDGRLVEHWDGAAGESAKPPKT